MSLNNCVIIFLGLVVVGLLISCSALFIEVERDIEEDLIKDAEELVLDVVEDVIEDERENPAFKD